MAQFSLTVTTVDATAWVASYRAMEKGRLKSLAAVAYSDSLPWGSTFVEVGTMIGGRGDAYKAAVFYCGYFSFNSPAIWTGDYPFEPSEEMYFQGKSTLAILLKLVGKVEVGDP